MVENLRQRAPSQIIVLIFDSVAEVSWDFLKLLERYFLAPVAELEQVLLVISGRPPMYIWESQQLRIYVKAKELPPFGDVKTETQIKRLDASKAARIGEIYRLGGGYPGTTARLTLAADPMEVLGQNPR